MCVAQGLGLGRGGASGPFIRCGHLALCSRAARPTPPGRLLGLSGQVGGGKGEWLPSPPQTSRTPLQKFLEVWS